MFGDSCEPNHNFSSPGSLEVTSEAQALRQLEEELNTNEDSFNERVIYKDKSATLSAPNDQGQLFVRYNGRQGNLDKLELFRNTVFFFFLLEGVDKINMFEVSDI